FYLQPSMNQTSFSIKEFLIVGLPGVTDQESRRTLFGVFFTVYLFTLVGNILLIGIFASDRTLQTPMYILMCGLAVLDIAISTNTLPSMLVLIMLKYRIVSLAACYTQTVFLGGFFQTECFLLTLMAYDRFIAICYPLHYPNLISNSRITKLFACCWVFGFFSAAITLVLLHRLSFCNSSNVIYVFCDFASLLSLACGDNQFINYIILCIGLSMLFIPLVLILFSYLWIIISIFKIASKEGRMKAFYTCGTHMLVISVFFFTAAGVFISDRIPFASVDARILGLVVRNVFPALLNPIIYCLRTKEIRNRLVKMIKKIKVLPDRRKALFGVFLTVYLLILLGNILLIVIFTSDRTLHTPMYILVCGLAVLDIAISTNTVPSMLVVLISDFRIVPLATCFTQTMFLSGLFQTEFFLLTLMAYDRYVAICYPLHYPNLISNSRISKLLASCWLAGIFWTIISLVLLLSLSFCRPSNVIYVFCDFATLLSLACGDIQIINYALLSTGMSVLFISLILILLSYVRIIISVVRIASKEGRMKAFYTCGTHMLVISVFFLTAGGVFISDKIPFKSFDTRILGLVVRNVFPALMNPVIYCLRTKQIRQSLVKMLKKITI
ncbi:OR1E5 protein, partial [Polypterus senegalus]|nr:OR1E5 protein [Polypterus senegalus]